MIATVKVEDNPLTLFLKYFRAVCDMHSVRFGTQDSFAGFMQQLTEDRKFAMDFWALVGRFSSREGGQLTDQQMQDAIVHEIAGCAMTSVDDSLKPQIDDFARMLAGEDVQSPVVYDDDMVEETVAPPVAAITSTPAVPAPKFSSVDRFPDTFKSKEQAVGTPPYAPVNAAQPPPHAPPSVSAQPAVENRITDAPDQKVSQHEAAGLTQQQLDDALLRLELNSLELKLHLDNIDSRMSRMEPHLEDLAMKLSTAARATVPPQQVREPIQPREPQQRAPIHEPVRQEPVRENIHHIQESVGRAVERSRLVLEPQPAPTPNPADDDPSISIPLAAYAQRRFPRSLALFAALLLIGIGGFFVLHTHYGASLWQDFGPSLRERYEAARHELQDVMKGHTTNDSAESDAASNDASQTQPAPVASATPNPVQNVTPTPAPEQSVTPTPEQSVAPSSAQTTNEPAEFASKPQTANSKENPHSKRRNTVLAAAIDSEMAPSSESASTRDSAEAPVPVAPSVMEENLVVSRVPAYPEVAKADHVEGPVVMQAIISKNGTVGHLQVIQGDPMLRSAASEAVSKWRYRPYTVNGKPVEVATTVTVDFRLKP